MKKILKHHLFKVFVLLLAVISIVTTPSVFAKYSNETSSIAWSINLNATAQKFIGVLASESLTEGGKVIYGVENVNNGKTFEENIKDADIRSGYTLEQFQTDGGYRISVLNNTDQYLKVTFDLQLCLAWFNSWYIADYSPSRFNPSFTVTGELNGNASELNGKIHGIYDSNGGNTDVYIKRVDENIAFNANSGKNYNVEYNEKYFIIDKGSTTGSFSDSRNYYIYSAIIDPIVVSNYQSASQTPTDCVFIIPPGQSADYYNVYVDYPEGDTACYAAIKIKTEPWVPNAT